MKKFIVLLMLLILSVVPAAHGALTYGTSYYLQNLRYVGSGTITLDPLYLNINEVGNLVGATAGTSTASKALVMNSSNQLDTLRLTGALRLLESTGATYYTLLQAGNQSANLTYTLPTADGTNGQVLSTNGSGTMSWATATGTFTGGTITSDVTLNDAVDIMSTTTPAQAATIKVYDNDTGPAYTNVLSWTNGNVPAIALGSDTSTFALNSTTIDVAAGAITGVTTLNTSGAVTVGGALSANSWVVGAGTFSTTGATTLGDGTSTVAIVSTGMDVSTGGAVSNVTTLGMSGDLTNSGGDVFLANGKGIKASTTTAQTVGVYGYDTDGAYVGALVVTNSATPATVLGNANGTSAVTSSDWAISPAGVATGLGAVTMDGTLTFANGETILNDTDDELQFAGNTEDVSFGFAVANTLTWSTDTGVDTVDWAGLDAFTGLETLTGDNGQNIDFSANGNIELNEASENLQYIFTANKVQLGSNSAVDTFDFNDVDALIGVQSITGDGSQSVDFAENGNIELNEASENLQFIFTSNQVQLGTNTGVNVFDVNSLMIAGVGQIRAAGSLAFIDLQNSNRVEMHNGTETFGFNFATGNTVEFVTDSAVATIDFNDVDVLVDIESITGDGAGGISGFVRVVTDDTNGKTLATTESGTVQTNAGAVGAAAWTLPAAAIGLEYQFVVMAAQELRVTPAAGDVININGIAADAAEYWTANAAGECLHLIAVDTTNWIAVSYTGTWTQQTP